MTTDTRSPNVLQTTLPGQAAAPAGPVDVHMMYVLHHAFRRDLSLFAAAAVRTPASDRVTWRALHERWQLFGDALHHHHSGEDRVLWPMLRERATDAERATLDAMEDEHAGIDPLLTACGAGFTRVLDERSGTEALAADLVAARTSMLAHLGHEETEAMALVQKYFAQADWDAMVHEAFDRDQSPSDGVRVLPWVLDGLPTAAASRLPTPMRVLARLGRRRFVRLDTRTRRYLS